MLGAHRLAARYDAMCAKASEDASESVPGATAITPGPSMGPVSHGPASPF